MAWEAISSGRIQRTLPRTCGVDVTKIISLSKPTTGFRKQRLYQFVNDTGVNNPLALTESCGAWQVQHWARWGGLLTVKDFTVQGRREAGWRVDLCGGGSPRTPLREVLHVVAV